MSIDIYDLNGSHYVANSSLSSSRKNLPSNLRELSEQELKTCGGAGHHNFRTVIVSDDDIDVYFLGDSVSTNFVYNSEVVEIKPNRRINFDSGNVVMRSNGDIDITISDSDSDSASDFS